MRPGYRDSLRHGRNGHESRPDALRLARRELEGRDICSLRAIVCGGSAVPKALSEAYRERLGRPILHAGTPPAT